jgi:hypothetical protein
MADVSTPSPCPGCGAQVYDDAAFCQSCGRALAGASGASRRTVGGKVETARDFVDAALGHAQSGARVVMGNSTAQKLAGGALLGAGAAVVLPFVSMGMGAAAGVAYVGYKLLQKD